MKKLILTAVFASALMATGAYAQTDTTTTSTTTTTTEQGKRDKDKEKVEKEKVRVNENDRNRDNVKETTTTETTAGTVEEYTPGESIVVRTAAAEPVHYRLSKQVVYVNAAGQVVEASAIRKTAHVHYHFVHEGNETVVDRVIVD